MRKLFLMAAAAATLFVSCETSGGGGSEVEIGPTRLTIKLPAARTASRGGAAPDNANQTRATEAPGSEGVLSLTDGHIFVMDGSTGEVILQEPLDMDGAVDAGGAFTHILGGAETPAEVPSDALVYVIGNVPGDVNVGGMESWSDISAAVSSMAGNSDYATAAMANSTGAGEAITIAADGLAEASIELTPLFSRLELHSVTGGENIVSFTVSGVFVYDYDTAFTMTGAPAGTHRPLSQNVTGNMGNTGNWESGDDKVATAGGGSVWAYHVPSAGLPRFVIRLSDLVYMASDDGGQTFDVRIEV
ncbi:MAG: hypothetical protein LBU97_01635, partial [Alistipes sp.]|nr:hypothetical protein [Alistipes sp.]